MTYASVCYDFIYRHLHFIWSFLLRMLGFGRNRQSVCPPQLLHPLPIPANHAAYACVHDPCHPNNGMQMVGHQAELQNPNVRIVPAHHIELINDCIAQCRTLHSRLRRVVLSYHQRAQQRLARRHSQRNMINANTPPCRTRLLPLPLFFCHTGFILSLYCRKITTFLSIVSKEIWFCSVFSCFLLFFLSPRSGYSYP